MSGIRQGSHLEHLHELRDRVNEEIVKEEARMKAADKRRAELAAAQRQNERAAEREAERAARREEARAAREEAALERLAEVQRIEAAAPADLVRTWAREHDITVGDRGRIPLDLRKQYLEATQKASTS
jgi:hypothetical protein